MVRKYIPLKDRLKKRKANEKAKRKRLIQKLEDDQSLSKKEKHTLRIKINRIGKGGSVWTVSGGAPGLGKKK
ncbi:uncharacterized protein METZ01_LOCUS147615 [marine metagenome]|uniref:Uncharacterized protein n=1 Tax=marine metagenome TaxID=408172 RepID=A0A382A0K1_9ZZZZ